MSFMREVVELATVNRNADIRKNVQKLTDEIKKFQDNVRSFVNNKYVDFLPELNEYDKYHGSCESLFASETDDLLRMLEEEIKMDVASEELRQCHENFQEIAQGLRVTHKILKIDQLFSDIELAKSTQEHLTVMNLLCELRSLIQDPTDNILKHLNCYENIKIQYCQENESMLHNLKLKFESLVQMTEKTFQNMKCVTVKISKNENELHQIVTALVSTKYNSRKMCEFLMENVFRPIITKPVSLDGDKETDPQFVTLQLSYSLKEKDDLRPNYRTVFQHIKSAFSCLGHMNISISESECVFRILREYMKETFVKLIMSECLDYSIPDNMMEMNESTLVDDITEFNEFLVEMLFLSEEDRELLEYAEKIELLFRNRFFRNILDNAVDIMRKDLHDMIPVAEKLGAADAGVCGPAIFPSCMVSKSTMELISLMERVLKEIEGSETKVAQGLLSTISIILDRYLTEIPTYHAKLLLNIPQQTALFHNNCMYLAFWITKNQSKGIETVSVMVKSLQHLGSEQFLNQIKNQRSQLMDILKGFDLSDAVSELGLEPFKVVRQCLRQLDLLKNVWQTILPDVVYNKTMGNLLNEFCNELIRRILLVEDLPSAVSNGLVEVCTTIIERAPSIFQDPLEINTAVKSWGKLQQLKMILSASMAEITEQWSSGKGPLTMNYKPEEIKHLIRALFQNTNRRAIALNSIV
ncbi:centromere/kinetochore protein zw10 [Phlebotomus argentipes]|uniref:centromere/kinetochore protein zw10 n=1 Tax=Phlebotomus argentipes TaxID=94469 RepID=UPI0028936B5D|nr:centromere/kinetochore protein zw10 [Phlebotomus argentipes]